MTPCYDHIREAALRLAKTPNGCVSTDPAFGGLPTPTVGNVIGKLVAKGLMHTAFVSHKKRVWFDTAERARAFEASIAKPAPSVVIHAPVNRRAAWDAAEPRITSATKVFIAETPKPRFAAVEFGAIVPALQRGRVTA